MADSIREQAIPPGRGRQHVFPGKHSGLPALGLYSVRHADDDILGSADFGKLKLADVEVQERVARLLLMLRLTRSVRQPAFPGAQHVCPP